MENDSLFDGNMGGMETFALLFASGMVLHDHQLIPLNLKIKVTARNDANDSNVHSSSAKPFMTKAASYPKKPPKRRKE